VFETVKGWVSSAKAKIRAKLKKLPPIEVLWRERRAYAQALMVLGDKAAALEPEQIADLEYVRLAVRAAQFAAQASGSDKLIEVQAAVRAAWSTVGIADVVFDSWWETMARPFIDAYVSAVKANDAWVPPA